VGSTPIGRFFPFRRFQPKKLGGGRISNLSSRPSFMYPETQAIS